MVRIGVGRELLNVNVVVLQFKAIEEPCTVAHDRSGGRKPGNKFVEAQSIRLAKRWKEIRGVEAKLVVSHPGVESHDTTCGLAEITRETGCFRIDGTNCICADAHGELSTDWGTNIEPIEQIESCIRFRPCNMNLAGPILHDTRSEG